MVSLTFKGLNVSLPVYIEKIGGSVATAGLPLTALTIGAVLIRPVTGWALDSYGRRVIFLSGILLFFLCSVVYIWLIPVYFLIAVRFIQGLGWGVCNTAVNTIASDNIPLARLGEGLGVFFLTQSITMVIAPAASLWLLNNYSFRTFFSICSLSILFSLILALMLHYPRHERQTNGSKAVFFEKTAVLPALIVLLTSLSLSSALSFLVLYAMQKGLTTAGAYFAAMSLTTFVTRPLSGRLTDKLGNRGGYDLLFVTGALAMSIAMPILAQTSTTFHMFAGGILNGVGLGFIQAPLLTLCVRNVPADKKGAANATYWTGVDLGIAIGSVLWGIVAVAVGYRIMFNLATVPMIVAFITYLFFRKTINRSDKIVPAA